jgi:hypothetical protein
MSRFLLSLWLLGAVLIAGSTLVAMNAIFGWTAGTPKADRTIIAERKAGTENAEPGAAAANQSAPQGSQEPSAPRSASQQAIAADNVQPDQPGAEAEATETALESGEADDASVPVRVATGANLRAGPSSSARLLSSLEAGTELRAIGRDRGWIEIADADGASIGWIYQRLLEPIGAAANGGEANGAEPQGEIAIVTDSAAVVRAGPSEDAAMLFGFPFGRTLRVVSREAGFAEVEDVASKQKGWIAESALASEDLASQRKSRSAPYAAARSDDVALPWDETMRAERPRKRARQARRGGFFARAIRRGLGGY